MRLKIAAIKTIGKDVRQFELRAAEGQSLPAFESGAHLKLTLPGDLVRRYSLTSDPLDRTRYTIAVQFHARGKASCWLHEQAQIGDWLEAEAPENAFALASAEHTILIAGGIGITPILSHARELEARGASFEVHYAARDPQRFALRAEIPGAITCYASSEGERLDLVKLLAKPSHSTQLYVCGPRRMLDAVREYAAAAGWKPDQIHIESFGAVWESGDRPVPLELSLSGIRLDVPAGLTLLEAMEQAGLWVPFDCRRGECHMCTSRVVSGQPIHRDHCLSPSERASFMTPCVSWANGPLVLEL